MFRVLTILRPPLLCSVAVTHPTLFRAVHDRRTMSLVTPAHIYPCQSIRLRSYLPRLQISLESVDYTREKIQSMATKDLAAPRPMHLCGVSRNPDYIVGTHSTSFNKTEDGKRLAPISQFNTSLGRSLAQYVAPESDADHRTVSQKKKAADRNLLPSQRPRTDLSRFQGMPRSSSRKGTTRDRKDFKEINTDAKSKSYNVPGQVTATVTSPLLNKRLPLITATETAELTMGNALRRKVAASTHYGDDDMSRSPGPDLWEEAGVSDIKTGDVSLEEEVPVILDTVCVSKQPTR